MKVIVLTTINVPNNLIEFIEKAEGEWYPIVVGDLKTPHKEVFDICKKVNGIYLSPDIQMTLGFSHTDALPWNCYDRKNIGYLFAYKEGAEIIYSTDDDNYPPDHWDSYVNLGKQDIRTVSSKSGWWNCLSESDNPITPRGFPYWLIREPNVYHRTFSYGIDVGVQVGLWTGDADVDAITRIVADSVITYYKDLDFALAKGTMCPYNSQNTFISREMLPAHMLWCGAGTPFYRYDDIFAGYVAQVIGWHHGKSIKFGRPILRQERNPHNLIKDLKSEIGGMEIQEYFFNALKSIKFSNNSVADNLRQFVYEITDYNIGLPYHNLRNQVDTWCNDLEKIDE